MESFLVRTLPIPSPLTLPSISRPSLPVNLRFSPSSESIRTTSLPNPIAFTLIGDSARPRARSSGPKTSFSLRLFHSSRCSPSNWLFATIKCRSQLFWITWRGFSSCPEWVGIGRGIEDRSVRCCSIRGGGAAAVCSDFLTELGFSDDAGIYREYHYRTGRRSPSRDRGEWLISFRWKAWMD